MHNYYYIKKIETFLYREPGQTTTGFSRVIIVGEYQGAGNYDVLLQYVDLPGAIPFNGRRSDLVPDPGSRRNRGSSTGSSALSPSTFARDRVLGIGAGPYVGQEASLYDFLSARDLEQLSKTTSLLRGPTKTYLSSDVRRLEYRKKLCSALDKPLFQHLFRHVRVWRPGPEIVDEDDDVVDQGGFYVHFGEDDDIGLLQLFMDPGDFQEPPVTTLRSFLSRVLLNSLQPLYDDKNRKLLGRGIGGRSHLDLLFQYCELGLVPYLRVEENFEIPTSVEYPDSYIYQVWSYIARKRTKRILKILLSSEYDMEFESKKEFQLYLQHLYDGVTGDSTLTGIENEIVNTQEYKDLVTAYRVYTLRVSKDEYDNAIQSGYSYYEEYVDEDGTIQTRTKTITIDYDKNYDYDSFLVYKITHQLIRINTHPELCLPRPSPTLPGLNTLTRRGRKRQREQGERKDDEDDEEDEDDEKDDEKEEDEGLQGGKTYYTFKRLRK
jgi:hypothetical protein